MARIRRRQNFGIDDGTWYGSRDDPHGLPQTCPSCYSRDVTSRLVATVLAGLALLVAGCDNNSSTPTSPSGGSLQITTTRPILRAGETTTLVVTGSNGTPVTTATWTSTDSSVLTVSPTGVATAARAGRVTVTATSGTSAGSLALRVVPDYQGTWSGGLARLQLTCSAASTSPLCVPGAATSGTLTLRIIQEGDQLTAVLTDSAEPTLQVPLTGQVQADDQLALAGFGPIGAQNVRVEVTTMRATIDAALGTMTGSYQWLVARAPSSGGALQTDYQAQVQFRDIRR